jgi:hypothetical protein
LHATDFIAYSRRRRGNETLLRGDREEGIPGGIFLSRGVFIRRDATFMSHVHALLQLEDVPVDVSPGERVPSIRRCRGLRGHSLLTATRTFTIHVAVSLSAYLGAFLRALAFETIPLPRGIRLTPTLQRREPGGSYSVPGCRLSWRVGPHCSPGYFWDAFWITRRSVQPFSVPVLGQANNPRRLVPHNDDSEVRSCTYPCATVLGGIRWWVQRDRLSRPLHRVEGQSLPWGVCITLASRGEAWHLYRAQVIADLAVSTLHP